jgi:hypothetical protein
VKIGLDGLNFVLRRFGGMNIDFLGDLMLQCDSLPKGSWLSAMASIGYDHDCYKTYKLNWFQVKIERRQGK